MLKVQALKLKQARIQNTSKMYGNDCFEGRVRGQKDSKILDKNGQKNGDNSKITRETVSIFGSLLKKIVEQNSGQDAISSAFDLKGEVLMDLCKFIESKYENILGILYSLQCCQTCLVLSLILLDRVQRMNGIYLHDRNVYKLLMVGLLIAMKYYDDDCQRNSYYAGIVGIGNKELNFLEMEFLCMIRFEVYVEESVLRQYRNKIIGYGKVRS